MRRATAIMRQPSEAIGTLPSPPHARPRAFRSSALARPRCCSPAHLGASGPASAPPVPIAEEDIFALLYTSGTTGRPKGAMLTHLGTVHSLLHFEYGLAPRDGEISVLVVPASHVTGLVAIILTMLRVAGTIVLMPAFKARDFLGLASRERMSHALLVPAMYNLCLLDPEFAAFELSSWRIGGFGGAPMPQATIEQLAAGLPNLTLVNVYGSTETTSPVTMLPLGEAATHADTVGKALPCADVVVMNDSGREAAAGESGELWIGGAMIVPGYWRNEEADRNAFCAGYWKSGNVGSVDAKGHVRVFDRKKDMINRGGFKIYCIEVESVLSRHDGVIECAVIGHTDPVLGERLHALVVPRDASVAETEL